MKLLQIAISMCIFMVLCHSTERFETKFHMDTIDDIDARISEKEEALEKYINFVDNIRNTFESDMNHLNIYIEESKTYISNEDGKITNTQSYDTALKKHFFKSNLTFKEEFKKVKKLEQLYQRYKSKKIMYQDEYDQKTKKADAIFNVEYMARINEKENTIKKLENEKEETLKKLENEKVAIGKLELKNDISVDSIKNLKTEIDDSKKSHEKDINYLKNEKQEEIRQLKEEKQEELISLKTMHNKKMADTLHGVHLNYIIGIIIGSILILGLNGYFCCLKPDKTKAKNENEDLDIEAYGELSLSQIPIAPGVLATQGEGSISFSMAIGPMPEMSVKEEYEIPAQNITEIITHGEQEHQKEEGTKISLNLKELQIPIINRIPDHKPLQDHNYSDVIIDNVGEKETLSCVS